MITTLWENALTFVKYMLKYSDGILMFEDDFQMCVFRCMCVCLWVHVCGEREREMKKMPMCQEIAS